MEFMVLWAEDSFGISITLGAMNSNACMRFARDSYTVSVVEDIVVLV